eukprot:1775479-Rhodomonas_salina.1
MKRLSGQHTKLAFKVNLVCLSVLISADRQRFSVQAQAVISSKCCDQHCKGSGSLGQLTRSPRQARVSGARGGRGVA